MNGKNLGRQDGDDASSSPCAKPNPMIALDSAVGHASVLNYNLPASTTFTVRVFVPVDIPDDYWTETAKAPPLSPYVKAPFAQEKPPYSRHPTRSAVEKMAYDLSSRPTASPNAIAAEGEGYARAREAEVAIRAMGATHPALRTLCELPIAEDLLRELSPPAAGPRTATEKAPPLARSAAAGRGLAQSAPVYSPLTLLVGLADGKLPVWRKSFYGRTTLASMFEVTGTVKPQLFVIEEIAIATYLGNYGAGRTVKTFSLLPGEKTVISIKSWRTDKEDRARTENILDSYTEDSADEYEKLVNDEIGTSTQTDTTTVAAFSDVHAQAGAHSQSGKVGGSFNIAILSGGGGYNVADSTSTQDSSESKSSASSTRANAASALSKAMDRHVNQSGATRKHEVNVETKAAVTSETGVETTITRELQNINHSRVLNYAFRTLNQEFLTITYLKDVTIGFTKGIPGDGEATRLDNLDAFLAQKMVSGAAVSEVRDRILGNLLAVYDHEGSPQAFVRQGEVEIRSVGGGAPRKVSYWQKDPDVAQEWEGRRVQGVILNTAKRILPTDALIVEALLGQGEALDCYNVRLQGAAAEKAELGNRRERLALEILEGGAEMKGRADAYARMFNPPLEKGDE